VGHLPRALEIERSNVSVRCEIVASSVEERVFLRKDCRKLLAK
jgi:hypothetical protein